MLTHCSPYERLSSPEVARWHPVSPLSRPRPVLDGPPWALLLSCCCCFLSRTPAQSSLLPALGNNVTAVAVKMGSPRRWGADAFKAQRVRVRSIVRTLLETLWEEDSGQEGDGRNVGTPEQEQRLSPTQNDARHEPWKWAPRRRRTANGLCVRVRRLVLGLLTPPSGCRFLPLSSPWNPLGVPIDDRTANNGARTDVRGCVVTMGNLGRGCLGWMFRLQARAPPSGEQGDSGCGPSSPSCLARLHFHAHGAAVVFALTRVPPTHTHTPYPLKAFFLPFGLCSSARENKNHADKAPLLASLFLIWNQPRKGRGNAAGPSEPADRRPPGRQGACSVIFVKESPNLSYRGKFRFS